MAAERPLGERVHLTEEETQIVGFLLDAVEEVKTYLGVPFSNQPHSTLADRIAQKRDVAAYIETDDLERLRQMRASFTEGIDFLSGLITGETDEV